MPSQAEQYLQDNHDTIRQLTLQLYQVYTEEEKKRILQQIETFTLLNQILLKLYYIVC